MVPENNDPEPQFHIYRPLISLATIRRQRAIRLHNSASGGSSASCRNSASGDNSASLRNPASDDAASQCGVTNQLHQFGFGFRSFQPPPPPGALLMSCLLQGVWAQAHGQRAPSLVSCERRAGRFVDSGGFGGSGCEGQPFTWVSSS